MSNISLDLKHSGIELTKDSIENAKKTAAYLREDKEDFTGWVNWPFDMPAEWISRMNEVAGEIRGKCNKLIVIGIGGSYLGTAAVMDALGGNKPGFPEILYAGNNMSGYYHSQFKSVIENEDVCLCVVSKSGTTMESRLAFSVLKQWMLEKYGREECAKRIVAITDPVKGVLREEADREGYVTFEIPPNIGGRYSAFTPGILFPLAVGGIDIEEMLQGARDLIKEDEFWEKGLLYALNRYELYKAGKQIEVFEYYDPSLSLIGEWCKQLFGESEGKEGQGLFPASLTLSTDLHSMGQFLQEGNQIFFETVIHVMNREADVTIPASAGDDLGGRSLNELNTTTVDGVIDAHLKANIPIIRINIDELNEHSIGELLYFLMITAAVTGKLMGIDPFNQPGVEQYKKEVRKRMGIE